MIEEYGFSDVEVSWNGEHSDPWIDIDLHTKRAVSKGESTVVGRLSLTPYEAIELAETLLRQHRRIYRRG